MAAHEDEDMYLFQNNYGQTPNFAGQSFDDFLSTSPSAPEAAANASGCLNPNDLTIKRESGDNVSHMNNTGVTRSPPSSSGSSRSSLSIPAKRHLRQVSEASTTSQADTQANGAWRSGINGLTVPLHDEMFADADMGGVDDDLAVSNEQMNSDFDFETAASTPSGLDNAPVPLRSKPIQRPQGRTVYNTNFSVPGGRPPFFFGSRETSPLSAMLPVNQTQLPWTKQSPSAGLEETFNGINMDGDSPGNAPFVPQPNFSTNGFTFDPGSSSTPSTLAKAISSPPSTLDSADGAFRLKVLPTSLKSRVETQIPIRMILSPMPAGVKKLRLPTHTISKPKFLSKVVIERSPEILELHTSLVCTSAMQDPVRLQRAFARARGEDLAPLLKGSPASATSSSSGREDEEKPLNGGEVRICSGCIQRERKRASRKKLKKPDEEELFQKDEEKRVVVFNTNELKDWVEPTEESSLDSQSPPGGTEQPRPGSMQVELPMRIACYCRHQNEKMGFRVIFTIKDYRDNVIAQAITNSIMITDDHKTHNPPPQNQPSPPVSQAPQFPGAGVFSTDGLDFSSIPTNNPKMFKQSFSTTDLHGLQHNFNPAFPMAPAAQPFAIPQAQHHPGAGTTTPRNLSRPSSPSGPAGPTTKRRKQSGSGKLPSGLTMTRLETSNALSGPSNVPNSAISPSYATNVNSALGAQDRGFAMPGAQFGPSGSSPPTPNNNDASYLANVNRSFSFEHLPRQAVISAPSSRQPSRPGSPASNRNSFGTADPGFGQAVSNQLISQSSRRPQPVIHKVVPAEGSVTGGTEVTLLGHGFYQGLEVMFGDTEATTTTFWGGKCLSCITPPALQPGVVAVLFKHEHPGWGAAIQQAQTRHSVYMYTDDREMEMYRLALKTLGPRLANPTDNPYIAAQQLLGSGSMPSVWGAQGSYNGMQGHQRQFNSAINETTDLIELETNMLRVLYRHDQFGDPTEDDHLNHCRPTGLTLLHLASSMGLTRFVVGLLSRGANPDILDNNGNTPMHHAAMNGHTHIVHRLRVAGADHRIRSIRNFLPADLATSLLTHRAALISANHYRSRLSEGTPKQLRSRNSSSRSLGSFWEHASTNLANSGDSDFSDYTTDSSDGETSTASVDVAQPQEGVVRRDNAALNSHNPGVGLSSPSTEQSQVSPAAFMWAWRNSLAEQIHQFQQSAQWTMPNLPALPALPALPDYQTYPMMRRVSSLFPQRPGSRQAAPSSREGWWETLTGNSSPASPASPPAYSDLYPTKDGINADTAVKQASNSCGPSNGVQESSTSSFKAARGQPTDSLQSKGVEQGEQTMEVGHIQRIELRKDRKLFLFWIPLLMIVLGLMLHNMFAESTAFLTIYDSLRRTVPNDFMQTA